MSDFEQWAENDDYAMNLSIERDEDGRYRDIHIENMLRGWNAAIASMQGESVAYCGEDHLGNLCNFTTDKPISGWHKPLFTYPPSAESKIAEQDARIKELEQQLEAARKDAERWNAILHSGAYCPSDFGNPIGFSGRLGQYTKEQLNASVDDYISKHCNAAIRQIGGAE